jgi:hypothetical protein
MFGRINTGSKHSRLRSAYGSMNINAVTTAIISKQVHTTAATQSPPNLCMTFHIPTLLTPTVSILIFIHMTLTTSKKAILPPSDARVANEEAPVSVQQLVEGLDQLKVVAPTHAAL